MRAIAEKARRASGASEADHWEAVSYFAMCYVASRLWAPETLSFRSAEHGAWCDTIMQAIQGNADKDLEAKRRLYAVLIANNAEASGYVDWMAEQTLRDW